MCTNISFPRSGKNCSLISGRTWDWAERYPTKVTFVPRGQSFPAIERPEEIEWENELAFVGVSYQPADGRIRIFYDGINEAGLSASGLSLFCSEYPEPEPGKQLLYNNNLVSYVLSSFRTVEEAENGLSQLSITRAVPDISRNLHYIISDASGSHLVVEFIDGKMKTYTTSLGVLTNDPPYEWHLANLSLYEQLSLTDKQNSLCGVELGGSGQLGIPGDPTPQSRFVRAEFFSKTRFYPRNTQQSIGEARQILQTLSVPAGTVYLREYPGIYSWTQWSVIRDHTNRSYYFYTDFNSNLYAIHLNELDLNSQELKQIDIRQPDWHQDLSGKLC